MPICVASTCETSIWKVALCTEHISAARISRSIFRRKKSPIAFNTAHGCGRAYKASSVSFRMQRDAIAFAIEHDRAEAVRADRMRVMNHAAAIRHDFAHSIADAAVCVQI